MIERTPILDCKTYDRDATDKVLEKTRPFNLRHLAARSLVWTVINGCIGSNNKLNIHLKQFNKTTDGRSAYLAIEAFLLGNDHSSSLASAAEKVLRETTYTSNVKNWKIEDYITNHMEFDSILDDQRTLGNTKACLRTEGSTSCLMG